MPGHESANPMPISPSSIDPVAFARSLGMSLRRLAESANVPPETPSLRPEDARLQRYLRDAEAVLARATRLADSRAEACDWFRRMPLTAFAFATPHDLVAGGCCNQLLRYLEQADRWDERRAAASGAIADDMASAQACDWLAGQHD